MQIISICILLNFSRLTPNFRPTSLDGVSVLFAKYKAQDLPLKYFEQKFYAYFYFLALASFLLHVEFIYKLLRKTYKLISLPNCNDVSVCEEYLLSDESAGVNLQFGAKEFPPKQDNNATYSIKL